MANPEVKDKATKTATQEKTADTTTAPNQPAPQTEPASTDAEDLEKAKQLVAKQKQDALIAANAGKIADLKSKIAEADKTKAKYTDTSDPDWAEFIEMQKTKNPNAFAAKMELPDLLRKELKELEDSLRTPEEVDLRNRLAKAEIDFNLAKTVYEQLNAELATKYPGAAPKAKAPKAAGEKKEADPARIEFTGTMLDKEVVRAKIKALVAGGTTSESAIVEAIYGTGFTIYPSQPRTQIHSIRLEEGYVAKKG